MRKFNEKRFCTQLFIISAMMVFAVVPAFAAGFNDVVAPVVELLNGLLGPLMAIVAAVGSLYCILLGVKYARAEEPQDREKAKAHLKGAIIGFVLIFILIVALKLLIGPLSDWASSYNSTLTK